MLAKKCRQILQFSIEVEVRCCLMATFAAIVRTQVDMRQLDMHDSSCVTDDAVNGWQQLQKYSRNPYKASQAQRSRTVDLNLSTNPITIANAH